MTTSSDPSVLPDGRVRPHRRITTLLFAVLCLGHAGAALAVDPPGNIRLEDGLLRWDPVENAVNYNVYFLSGPVVDVTVTPRYAGTVGEAREFPPFMDGFYTVVTVGVESGELAYSDVADGGTVAVTGLGDGPSTVIVNDALQIRSARCDGVVAGGACESRCPLASRINPMGGACRADAGVVLHQRASINGFECISQSDTSFVEVDVYCLNTSNR